MNIASHVEKIRRLERVRHRLDPVDDFELWFWASMTAGTHAVNAALHATGLTDAGDHFPTQPGVYLVSTGNGGFAPAFRPLGDILHVGRPTVEGTPDPAVARMMAAMETIEHHRDPCIRGEREPTSAVIADCEAAYQECLRHAQQVLSITL